MGRLIAGFCHRLTERFAFDLRGRQSSLLGEDASLELRNYRYTIAETEL